MYKVSEEDRKEFLNYLAKKPYIEVAGLVARIAGWQVNDCWWFRWHGNITKPCGKSLQRH